MFWLPYTMHMGQGWLYCSVIHWVRYSLIHIPGCSHHFILGLKCFSVLNLIQPAIFSFFSLEMTSEMKSIHFNNYHCILKHLSYFHLLKSCSHMLILNLFTLKCQPFKLERVINISTELHCIHFSGFCGQLKCHQMWQMHCDSSCRRFGRYEPIKHSGSGSKPVEDKEGESSEISHSRGGRRAATVEHLHLGKARAGGLDILQSNALRGKWMVHCIYLQWELTKLYLMTHSPFKLRTDINV